jgi:hypothetical protein
MGLGHEVEFKYFEKMDTVVVLKGSSELITSGTEGWMRKEEYSSSGL